MVEGRPGFSSSPLGFRFFWFCGGFELKPSPIHDLRPDELRVYPMSICVLSGCGGNTEKRMSKQNSCLTGPLLIFLFSRSSLLFLPLLRLRPPLLSPRRPVAELQQRLGKADCGIPGKPLRAQGSEGWRGRAAVRVELSTFTPLLGFSLKKKDIKNAYIKL